MEKKTKRVVFRLDKETLETLPLIYLSSALRKRDMSFRTL